MNDSDTDAVLVMRALTGERDAYSQLVWRHAPRLAAYLGARIRRQDLVEQFVGEAVALAWRYLYKLEDPAGFGAWFRQLGANLAMRWRRNHPGESLKGEFPVDRCADLEEAGAMARLDEALGTLGERHRMALEHRFRGGLHGRDLVEALHVTDVAAADAAVSEALQRLGTVWPARES